MYIWINKPSGKSYSYVYLVESVRNPVTKKNTKKIIEKYGRLEDLQRDQPGKLEELLKKYPPRKSVSYSSPDFKVDDEPFVSDDVSNSELVELYSNTLNFGWLALRWTLLSLLGLDAPLSHLNKDKYNHSSAGQSEGAVPLNTIASMLIARKAMGGDNIQKVFEERDEYWAMPKDSITQDDLYRAMPILADSKDYILNTMHESLSKTLSADGYSLLIYDVSHEFFWHYIRDEDIDYFTELFNKCSDSTNDAAVQTAEVDAAASIPVLASEDLPKLLFLLVTDKNGMPVDYEILPGKGADLRPLKNAVDALKSKYDIDEAFVLANTCLNLVENVEAVLSDDMGYFVAQNLHAQDKSVIDELKSEDGYIDLPIPEPKGRRYKFIKRNDAATLAVTCDKKCWRRSLVGYNGFVFRAPATKAAAKAKKAVAKSNATAANGSDAKLRSMITDEQLISSLTKLKSFESVFSHLRALTGFSRHRIGQDENLKAHVLLGILALVSLYIIERKMLEHGHRLSIEQLITVLKGMNLSTMPPVRSKGDMQRVYGVNGYFKGSDLKYTYVDPETNEECKNTLREAAFSLLKAIGLKTLPGMLTLSALCSRLAIELSDKDSVVL